MEILLPIILLAALAAFFAVYGHCIMKDLGRRKRMTFRCYPMERKDALPLAVILLVYGVVGFLNLGSTEAPQTFYQFNTESPSVTLELQEAADVGQFMYYTGLYTGSYALEYSSDGVFWTMVTDEEGQEVMTQPHSDLFKWIELEAEPLENVRYIRITATASPLELGEVVLRDAKGQRISYTTQAKELNDEYVIAPESPSWYNSTYFDEIYHARTAYEHINNVYPYEVSHPPLGKIIISIGIRLFGMTPFGWRFMGTLFGVLMLIPFYVLVKNMFGKTPVAVCSTLIFAFDFMHFVQTRIATIDTYGVMFILLSYLFMWRYVSTPYDRPFKVGLKPLMLSGLFFGIGCASKWIVVYAGVGLAAIYLLAQILRWRHHPQGYGKYIAKTLAFSVLGFVVVPVVIYCLSYIPYGLAKGMSFPEMLKSGEYYKLVWDNQVFMLTYHQGVHESHPYSSRWWQWIFDIRPILYYLEYNGDVKSAFGCFNNPLVAWAGLISMALLVVHLVRRKDGRAAVIIIGYLTQLIPWVIISRITFEYHYFPCTVFLVLAIAFVLDGLWQAGKRWLVYGFTGVTLSLFLLFYPVLTGVWVNTKWCRSVLKWLPTWPFG